MGKRTKSKSASDCGGGSACIRVIREGIVISWVLCSGSGVGTVSKSDFEISISANLAELRFGAF